MCVCVCNGPEEGYCRRRNAFIIIIIIDRFYIALFSVLEQSHCARM